MGKAPVIRVNYQGGAVSTDQLDEDARYDLYSPKEGEIPLRVPGRDVQSVLIARNLNNQASWPLDGSVRAIGVEETEPEHGYNRWTQTDNAFDFNVREVVVK